MLDALPDEPLMQLLEAGRGDGRHDYPVRPMWNSLIAGFVFQHPSIAALRRELLRNGQLRDRCGFDPFDGAQAVPSEYAYTRFQRRLRRYQPQMEELFHSALDELRIELPDLGQVQALDGKELHSLAKGQSTYPLPKDTSQKDTDGRRDRDANWGVKGSGERKHYWFGYLLHLVVDATYEVPLAFAVTKASTAEQPQAQRLLDQMQDRHPGLLQRCGRMSADKGYDDHKLIDRLWQQHQIKPIIAIRNCWQDGEAEEDGVPTKLVSGQENVIYTHDGQVSCMCPHTGELHSMAYGGFEQDRETLKYRCPARYSGITCKGMDRCPVSDAVRIPLAEDRRVFTPVARSSYRWQDYYDQRSAVERVNSRVGWRLRVQATGHPRAGEDASARHHGADDHAGDGPVGRIRAGQPENLRSLVRPA